MEPRMPDDRRSLRLRLSVLQYAARDGCSARSPWRSGSSRSPITRSSARWRRTITCSACRCRRRAVCCFDRNGKVLVAEPGRPRTSCSSASRRRTSSSTLQVLALATGADVAAAERRASTVAVRDPSYRPIVLIENAILGRRSSPLRRASWSCRASSPQEVPARRYTGHGDSPRICSGTSARSPKRSCSGRVQGPRRGRDRRPGRRRAGVQPSC